MIPLRDDNPTVLWPLVTVALILVNTAVFFYELSLEPKFLDALIYQMGMVPAALLQSPIPGSAGYFTVLTSMFLHGGWMHIIGNMLYLWIFGNNIEDSMGHLRFIFFYLVTGLAAAAAHLAFNAASTVPTIGASGAVSGVLGAYLVLFPHARVQTLVTLGFFIRIIYVPAWVLLIFWIGLQLLNQALAPIDPAAGGVAYAAHIGGFAAGLVLIPLFRKHRRRTHFRYS
ncbi:MAG: rhomboid family intramembrane serine protease [Deltaproteobacteria bacterium]|nr:rhomboid family intramembrane serine protease [Deltaproteobacteria bacterium]